MMKACDIKVGGIYETAWAKLGYWSTGDTVKVLDILAIPDGNGGHEPVFRCEIGSRDYPTSSGVHNLSCEQIVPLPPAHQPHEPTPRINFPPWDPQSGPPTQAEERLTGYLGGLLDASRDLGNNHLAQKAVCAFLKHIGYKEVAELYERFV